MLPILTRPCDAERDGPVHPNSLGNSRTRNWPTLGSAAMMTNKRESEASRSAKAAENAARSTERCGAQSAEMWWRHGYPK